MPRRRSQGSRVRHNYTICSDRPTGWAADNLVKPVQTLKFWINGKMHGFPEGPGPKELPEVRPRRLSAPLPPDAWYRSALNIKSRRTFHQERSIGRLPYEIREQIYLHLLTDHTFAISFDLRGPRHDDCEVVYQDPANPRHRRKLRSKGKSGILGFLMTCRLIYTEGMNYLYSRNEFVFLETGSLYHFSRTVLKSRLQKITRAVVVIHFLSRSRESDWAVVADIINNMSGLKKLRFEYPEVQQFSDMIRNYHFLPSIQSDAQNSLTEPLCRIEKPDFELYMAREVWSFANEGNGMKLRSRSAVADNHQSPALWRNVPCWMYGATPVIADKVHQIRRSMG